ncbi:MAG: methyltransferase domain-containing protein, partial [Desulfovibrionales bacterium]
MKHELRRAFERARDTYPDAALVQKTVAGNLAATIPPGRWDPILEIGSGGGFLHRMLQKHSVTGPYVSLDLTRSMLQMTETGDGTPHLMVQADGESPPFRDRSFHLLVSSSTLQWFQRPQHSIPALLALLRHGGIFAFSLFVEGTLGELSESSRRTGFGSIHP